MSAPPINWDGSRDGCPSCGHVCCEEDPCTRERRGDCGRCWCIRFEDREFVRADASFIDNLVSEVGGTVEP